VEAGVVGGVENPVESDRAGRPGSGSPLELRLLGPMAIRRQGVALDLPASRKVRALLAYLVVSPQPVPRRQLCELLWDVPNDPRGELRWCLSKLRRLLDTPGRPRVVTRNDTIALDLTGDRIDAAQIADAIQDGIDTADAERLRALSLLFTGEFLDGLEVDRSPHFSTWLAAERRRFRGRHAAVLERLVKCSHGQEVFGHLEKWLELAPFDRHAHQGLLQALATNGRIRDGEEHLASLVRLFDAEGLDHRPLREYWRTVRMQANAAPLAARAAPGASDGDAVNCHPALHRASIAVMPFADRAEVRGGYADGLVHDVITRLAKLRSLFVIAQGTVFALHERRVGREEAGRALDVDYVVTGSLHRQGKRLTVAVELVETRTARIAWAEVFDKTPGDVLLALGEIGDRIVAGIAGEIETIERNRAVLKPPNSLNAWEAYHRGLWHMYRFNKADNDQARHFFDMALNLDPTFARAHAGLSFTCFQNAFQGWAPREQAIDRAFESAGQSLMADDRDPTAHLAMGRALWLRGQPDQSVAELETSIDLSPNFALGHYSLAFVRAQAGDAVAAIASSDHSRHLSPFDPLLFGMLASRAIALVRLDRFEEATEWAVKAAARPNAHAHIVAIAACSLALAGALDEARDQAAKLRRMHPHYRIADLLAAFHFDAHGARLFQQGAQRIGMA
jgi:DNA-binding SARP family transcriptional activator/TolB-like protein